MGAKPLDPELAAAVERARKHMAEKGGWPRKKPLPPFESKIPPEAAEIITAWSRDGGYDEAIAEISAEDPGQANK